MNGVYWMHIMELPKLGSGEAAFGNMDEMGKSRYIQNVFEKNLYLCC